MKPILLFLSLLSFHFSFGQHYFGVKVAPGLQTTTYDSGIEYSSTFSMRSGLHYGYRFNEAKPWGIQSGVYYNQRGYRINDLTFQHSAGVFKSGDYISKRNNIGLNVLLKVERSFLYASAGPCFEFTVTETGIKDYEIESLTDIKWSYSPDNFSEAFYFGYELNLGTQFSITEKLQFFTELSMNQVFGEKSESFENRIGYFNMNLAFGINYHF
ncbi:MAG: outer membrane beta-barrel protein [Crocinitomix sp.]|nr:outer membrane beta-barrel protein [Crocinitomix sp.]